MKNNNNKIRIIIVIMVAVIFVLVVATAMMLRTGKYLDDSQPGKYAALDTGHFKIVPVDFIEAFAENDALLMEEVDEIDYSEERPTFEIPNAMLVAYTLSGFAITEEIWEESSDLWQLDEINALVEDCSPMNSSPHIVNLTYIKTAREDGQEVRYQTILEFDLVEGYIHWGTARITESRIPVETIPYEQNKSFTALLINAYENGGSDFHAAVGEACTVQALSGGENWEIYYWDNAGNQDPYQVMINGKTGEVRK